MNHKYKVCKNKDFCGILIPSEDTKMSEFNQYWKYNKTPSIIYPDLESFIQKVDGCKYNPEKSSAAKLGSLVLVGIQCLQYRYLLV